MASEEPELVDRMDEDDKHFPSLDAEDGEAERDAEETDMFLCARCRQVCFRALSVLSPFETNDNIY